MPTFQPRFPGDVGAFDHDGPRHCKLDGRCIDFVDHLRHQCCDTCHPLVPPQDASPCPTVSHGEALVDALRDLIFVVERLTEKLDDLYGPDSDAESEPAEL